MLVEFKPTRYTFNDEKKEIEVMILDDKYRKMNGKK
jgi:hypothetical protein